jgi:hypothetical protein
MSLIVFLMERLIELLAMRQNPAHRHSAVGDLPLSVD